jgi:hypothetical protein
VTPQSLLPIPQTQVPSPPSSSLCPKRTQKASEAEAESGFTGLTTTLRRGISNRELYVLATLSIGLYLPLEGPVPTRGLYPAGRRINL